LKEHLTWMRRTNPLVVQSRDGTRTEVDEPIRLLVEDPVCRDSRESYFVQAADCGAFLLKQHIEPNGYMRSKGGHAYLPRRLRPVLCTHASNSNPLGIVKL